MSRQELLNYCVKGTTTERRGIEYAIHLLLGEAQRGNPTITDEPCALLPIKY
jgi:hypothetical protein